MQRVSVRASIKALIGLTYVVMIAVNALANALPINGRTTGAVSDAYQNLFAPAGVTFAIWGVIYLLLGAHVLYQLGLFRGPAEGEAQQTQRVAMLERVGVLFSLSSLANATWILSWHYELIAVSTVLLATMLVLVIVIMQTLQAADLSTRDAVFVRLPFSVYSGWLTVATIANITVWLVSINWDGFGIAEATWAAVIIAVGAVIGTAFVLRKRDIAYGLVLVWAYLGIWIKHTSGAGFQGAYPVVIATTLVGIAAFVVAGVVVALRSRSAR
ncbi:MAG: tryptophan-rich sensory protein [Actinobacteria bacterium]|nr:tryptophan-rich sensory protein [Propionicimonas sp.]MBU3975563.1 tryptophan-rich sensory protein [Actinomycetota bacterium]MBU3986288.1 tryptophan-rich sensory protein [Actinomycetota bacterium]MBU4007857.1 tryptophan-rich sensory protein [Actinomycetota bacterium]MBU4064115.1 tryptophan-rich sensory protein [Actinomycetota bacterium]